MAAQQFLRPLRRLLQAAPQADREDAAPIHRLRVACRRASAWLDGYGILFRWERRRRVQRGVRKLRKGAGRVRNWDVLKAALAERPLDSMFRHWLERQIDRHRQEARHQLVRLGQQTVVVGLTQDLRHLRRHIAWRSQTPPPPIALWSAAVVRRDMGALLAATQDVTSHPASLHRLRIRAKQLRYTVELFRPYLSPAVHKPLGDETRRLQDQLGLLNDLASQVQLLRELQRTAAPPWQPALATLIGDIEADLAFRTATFVQTW